MSSLDQTDDRFSAVDAIAGLLAAASIALSAIAMGGGLLLQLDAHPARLTPIAAAMAIVAGRMSARYAPLALKAAWFSAVAWVVGMTIAVITEAPLF